MAGEVVAQEFARDRVAPEGVGQDARDERAVGLHEAAEHAQGRTQVRAWRSPPSAMPSVSCENISS